MLALSRKKVAVTNLEVYKEGIRKHCRSSVRKHHAPPNVIYVGPKAPFQLELIHVSTDEPAGTFTIKIEVNTNLDIKPNEIVLDELHGLEE